MVPLYSPPVFSLSSCGNLLTQLPFVGVVFFEMLVVLKGRTVEYMYDFFKTHGSQQAYVRSNPAALNELVAELRETESLSDNRVLGWAQQMLVTDQRLRPTASSLVASILAAGNERGGSTAFCGNCCFSLDDDLSDVADELEGISTR